MRIFTLTSVLALALIVGTTDVQARPPIIQQYGSVGFNRPYYAAPVYTPSYYGGGSPYGYQTQFYVSPFGSQSTSYYSTPFGTQASTSYSNPYGAQSLSAYSTPFGSTYSNSGYSGTPFGYRSFQSYGSSSPFIGGNSYGYSSSSTSLPFSYQSYGYGY